MIGLVRKTNSGTKVNVIVVRDSKQKSLGLLVGKRKKYREEVCCTMFRIPDFNFRFNNRLLGLKVSTLNEQLAEYFDVPGKEGVLVEEVEKGSVGKNAGFKAGDIITKIGKKPLMEQKNYEGKLIGMKRAIR